MDPSDGDQRRHRQEPSHCSVARPAAGCMTLRKVVKPGGMTLQNFGQPLMLLAASCCICGGCMTLRKSAFRWLHEAANWHSAASDKNPLSDTGTCPTGQGRGVHGPHCEAFKIGGSNGLTEVDRGWRVREIEVPIMPTSLLLFPSSALEAPPPREHRKPNPDPRGQAGDRGRSPKGRRGP